MSYTYKPHEQRPAVSLPRETYDHWQRGMPLLDGYAVGMEYCPKQKLKAYQNAWRDWCKSNPRKDWPYHVTSYIEKLKREDKKSELLEMHAGE